MSTDLLAGNDLPVIGDQLATHIYLAWPPAQHLAVVKRIPSGAVQHTAIDALLSLGIKDDDIGVSSSSKGPLLRVEVESSRCILAQYPDEILDRATSS
jgi:hypothetical protein